MSTAMSDERSMFSDLRLPSEVEHRAHEFLRIAEVCALQGVSSDWHSRTRSALRTRFKWDVTHYEDIDVAAHLWVCHVALAKVNVRSLRLVSGHISFFLSFVLSFFLSFFFSFFLFLSFPHYICR